MLTASGTWLDRSSSSGADEDDWNLATQAGIASDYLWDSDPLGGRAEYHRPLGWNWQFDLDSRVTWPLRPGESGMEAPMQADANGIIADRWKAGVMVTHVRTIFHPRRATEPSQDSWDVSLTSGLSYYLEDRTELFVQVDQRQSKSGTGSSNFRRDTVLLLGLTYRFLGAFEAPGLAEPQRLMH
jgi:hypothetical protein